MRSDPHVLRSEAERESGAERLQRLHLAIKPCFRVFTVPIRPTYSSAQILHAKTLEPFDGEIQPRIFIVKPLADAHAAGKRFRGKLGRAVLAQESHIVMAIVGASFGFF